MASYSSTSFSVKQRSEEVQVVLSSKRAKLFDFGAGKAYKAGLPREELVNAPLFLTWRLRTRVTALLLRSRRTWHRQIRRRQRSRVPGAPASAPPTAGGRTLGHPISRPNICQSPLPLALSQGCFLSPSFRHPSLFRAPHSIAAVFYRLPYAAISSSQVDS